MTEIRKSHIVRSAAGHDRDRLFYVVDTEGEYLLLADGKTRKIALPKRKKRKHVCFYAESGEPAAGRLLHGETLGDSDVRKTLGAIRRQAEQER